MSGQQEALRALGESLKAALAHRGSGGDRA